MENSPLQLYKKAYDLHYKRKNLEKASYLYKELITNFPGSEIAKYASIQISKIQSLQIKKNILHKTFTLDPNLVTILMVMNIFLVCYSLYGLYSHRIDSHNQYSIFNTLINAMSNLYAGNEEEALVSLKEMKYSTPNDMTPYEISANIYLRHHHFNKARNEYKSFQALYPDNSIAAIRIENINKEEKLYKDSLEYRKIITKKKNKIIKQKIEKKKAIKEETKEEFKPPLIDEEDISYF